MLRLTGGLILAYCCSAEIANNARAQFAVDRGGNAGVAVQIDAKRVMDYLKQICAIGPRISGSKGMLQQQQLLKNHFTKLGGKVRFQSFAAKQISRPGAVGMKNLIVSWNEKQRRRVIICAHYDTRPIADQERDPRNWKKPFVSANDGGSGVAFLMELAHHMEKVKPAVGVDFVLFDGEEYIFNSKRDEYFFGSKHFAQSWRNDPNRPKYLGAVLLDMIAGKNPRFPAEGYSYYRSRPLLMQLWQIAGQQKCTSFQWRVGDHVQDDHLALQKVGIPAVDIIDFSYPHWHKLSDRPENCSPEGMIQVSRVLTVWLKTVR